MIFDDVIKGLPSVITEGKIYEGGGNSLSVSVDPNRKYGGNIAYFKFADNEDFKAAKRIIRISFMEPVYIVHNNQDKLTRKEIKWLMKALLKPYKKNPNITVWTGMIIEFNRSQTDAVLPIDLPIPDYTKLETR